MIDRAESLRHCPVLADFTEVGVNILASVVRERVFGNAQALQSQGEVARDEGVLFIASGRVRCEVRDADGRSLGLGTLGPGDHLGGMRLFASTPSPVSAIAEGEVTTLLLDRAAFERLRTQKPQTAMKLLFAITGDFGQRMAESSSMFAQFAVYAAQKANIEERGHFASYADLGMDLTPMTNTATPLLK
jgi:CRP-like cAMP-binding protein